MDIAKELYNELKDKIEFDEDVEALFVIIKKILHENKEEGIYSWLYLFQNYQLKDLKYDIDFTLLTHDFVLEILKKESLSSFLLLLDKMPIENKNILIQTFFNIFHKEKGIYLYFKRLILEEKEKKEYQELKTMLELKKKDTLTFDTIYFLRNILKIHLKYQKVNLDLLLKITNLAHNPKDIALLKTVLIDYL